MINFDDPSIAIALLLIIAGLRLALYVFERIHAAEPGQTAAPVISPDDAADEIAVQPEESGGLEQHIPPPQTNPYRFLNEVLEAAFIAVFLVFILIRPFVLQAFYIPSGSMRPTLLEGDKLLATKFTYSLREPRRQEIIVFHAPQDAIETLDKEKYDPKHPIDYVKRVIGIPGDHIRIVGDVGVFLNKKKLNEPYITAIPSYCYPTDVNGNLAMNTDIYDEYNTQKQKIAYTRVRAKTKPFIVGDELVVPHGYLFVMGDNRNSSHDGHKWGLLPRKALVGKAVFIFWPPKRIGFVR